MSFDIDPREEHDAEMWAAFAANDKRFAELEAYLAAQSGQEPAGYIVTVKKPGETREYATLPGYSVEFGYELIAEVPVFTNPPANSIAIVQAALEAAISVLNPEGDAHPLSIGGRSISAIRAIDPQTIIDEVSK